MQKKVKTKFISLRVNEDKKKVIESYCEYLDINQSEFIFNSMQHYIKYLNRKLKKENKCQKN